MARPLAMAGVALALVAAVSEAQANAQLCRQLETQLADASRERATSRSRKYDAAIERQRAELQKARARARQSNCAFGFLGGDNCGPLNVKIARMQDNLAGLQAEREKLGGGGSKRNKNRIMAALDKNGCRDQRTAERGQSKTLKEGRKGATLLDQILGRAPSVERDDPIEDLSERPVQTPRTQQASAGAMRGGSYRTYCVRACDGYFFPMSPASSQGDFPRDQQNCESACPGTDVRVYYRRGDGDDPAAMMSVAGDTPYSELPTAFAYRKAGDGEPMCGCRAAPRGAGSVSTASLTGTQPTDAQAPNEPVAQSSSIVVMQPRQEEDPAAAPSSSSPVDDEAVQRLLRQKANPEKAGERKVRVVGPVFLPDPEGVIDLRAPVPDHIQ